LPAAGKKEVKAEDMPVTKGNYPTYAGMETGKEPGHLKGVEFLRWVSLVLNDPSFTKQTDGYREGVAFKQFERLGLQSRQPFNPKTLTPEHKATVEAGIGKGRKDVLALIARGSGPDMNG